MSIERQRKAAQRTLSRRYGMSPAKSEELNRHVGALNDWHVTCPGCSMTIVGTRKEIAQHAEECRGA